MQKRPPRRPWIIPGMLAAVFFIGGLTSNLIASYLETTLRDYRTWVWSFFAIAFLATVVTAIVEARRRYANAPVNTDHSVTAETSGIVNANAERSVARGTRRACSSHTARRTGPYHSRTDRRSQRRESARATCKMARANKHLKLTSSLNASGNLPLCTRFE